MYTQEIVIENEVMRLVIGSDCITKSLLHKPTGEECLADNEEIPLFSVTHTRPFQNEIKLTRPSKKTVFQGNRIRRDGDQLIVGFELVPYEAVFDLTLTPSYIAVHLSGFLVDPNGYHQLSMDTPPVAEVRMLQLPVKNRTHFGEWLNVCWDEQLAVNVLATSPHTRIDAERRKDCRILTADAVRGIKLVGCGAVLIAAQTDVYLDVLDRVEMDFGLPRGVQSRRNPKINASIYWTSTICPKTVDKHIDMAKRGGFSNILIFWSAIFQNTDYYARCGEYTTYKAEYPRGFDDLKDMLDRIKAAGITPGIHFLHTHIGKESHYVTPVADRRLHTTQQFTLSCPLGLEDTVVYVDQNPEGAVMHPDCRVLKFGGELISYECYSNQSPYCFKGCQRGHFDTRVTDHTLGEQGGVLDFSEFLANSIYLDQNTDLQDEIADQIATFYRAGFSFIYFDGSEGTNPPYEYHIGNAQYRVYKKLDREPLFCEGAAKSHFSWHMLSGGNAFDVFPPSVFKEKIAQYPAAEAPHMKEDFTRLNFGWWDFTAETQPDIYEYGTSRAAAWDCPVTVISDSEGDRPNTGFFQGFPRTDDVLEVLRRWEDVRRKNWLTNEQKKALRDTTQEHILLVNEMQDYELVPYTRIQSAAHGDKRISAFVFERQNKTYVVFWHTTGRGKLHLQLNSDQFTAERILGGVPIDTHTPDSGSVIPFAGRTYFSSTLSKQCVLDAFEHAVITE